MTDLDLTCRGCRGTGKAYDPTHNDWYFVLDRTCTTCNGARILDRHQVALDVARAHGTRVAVEYSGLSDAVVRRLRREHDGYDRGRGRPSRAEMAAMEPRLDCTCLRCIDHRTKRSRHLNHVVSGLGLDRPALRGAWRDEAACADADEDLFFPERGAGIGEALAYCRRCPVRDACLEAGMDERYGIWGGLSERGRRRLRRLRRAKQAAA